MEIENIHQILLWSSVVFAVLAAAASGGTILTGKIMDAKKDLEISRLKPRTLSPDQASKLLASLSDMKGKVGFFTRLMDGEGADFAGQIEAVFHSAGWEVVPRSATSLNDFTGFVTLFVTGDDLGLKANRICTALNSVGITCKKQEIKENSIGSRLPDTIYIVVGRKP